MFRPFIIALLISAPVFSCNQKKQDNLQSLANEFAEVECKAISIREQRFQLANTIRFTEDTLRQMKTADSSRLKQKLQVLNTEKQAILQRSLLLADSIHRHLDSLIANDLKDKADKEKFNNLLNVELEKKGCKETQPRN
jgi:hypothetical protein